MEQAPRSPELLALVKELYPEVVKEDTPFFDLTISPEDSATTEDGIYYLPKTIARGERKGQIQAHRRENIVLYPASVRVITDEDTLVQEDLVHQINTPTV